MPGWRSWASRRASCRAASPSACAGLALGQAHPQTAISLNNLATLYQVQGQYAQARPLRQRGQQAIRHYLVRQLPAHPASIQLALLGQINHWPLRAALSLPLAAPQEPGLVEQSAGWLLNGKAVAHEALGAAVLQAREA